MFYTNKFVSDFPAGHKAAPKGKNTGIKTKCAKGECVSD